MTLSAFLSTAAGALTVVATWQAIQWRDRRRHPQPAPDEAICYNCRIMGGANLRLEADEATDHLRAHVSLFPGTNVQITARWSQQ